MIEENKYINDMRTTGSNPVCPLELGGSLRVKRDLRFICLFYVSLAQVWKSAQLNTERSVVQIHGETLRNRWVCWECDFSSK